MKKTSNYFVELMLGMMAMLCVVTSPHCLCGDIYYYASMKKENIKWYNSTFLNKAFYGVISDVHYKSTGTVSANFIIYDINRKEELIYGPICLDMDSPLKKILKGDTIIKDSGTILVTIKTVNFEFIKTPMKWCDF